VELIINCKSQSQRIIVCSTYLTALWTWCGDWPHWGGIYEVLVEVGTVWIDSNVFELRIFYEFGVYCQPVAERL